jgi:signal transduction histidine kinase
VARLHARIYLHVVGVLALVGLATSLIFAAAVRGGPGRELALRLARHAAAVAAEEFPDATGVERRLAALGRDLGVDLTARDLDGRLIGRGGPALPGLPASEAARVRAGETVLGPGRRLLTAAPILDPSGRVVGVLQLSAPRLWARAGPLGPILWVAAVLLVAALATHPLARRISRPLAGLTEAARRLGAGDLSARAPVPGPPGGSRWRHGPRVPDEVATLAAAFNEMAERIQRLVAGQKELLADVSHELRSPLARIRVALALLPREGESGRRLAELEEDLGELERLVEDPLAAARLEATGQPPHPEPVDPGRLLAEVADRAARDPAVGGTPVRVVERPAGMRLPVIVADAALLRRALWNLLENAARYGAPPIVLAAEPAGPDVVLSVSDAGPGIPPEERLRVLEPFRRLDRARTPGEGPGRSGVGLGLALARRVAEIHGGGWPWARPRSWTAGSGAAASRSRCPRRRRPEALPPGGR